MNDMAPIGHNLPPHIPTQDEITDALRLEHMNLMERRNELVDAEARIPDINDDQVAGKVSDYIKQITECSKSADKHRVASKEPYLAGGRAVDGFFKAISEPLDSVKKRTERKLGEYLREKEARERRAREEAERKAREEAERARREAEEAAARLASEADLTDAVDAERRAASAQAEATKAEKEANAKAAEMSRTRGEYGAVSSLRTVWTFADLDRAGLDLEALRNHLPMDGLEKAVRSYIRAGGRELRGVSIYEEHNATVR